MAKDEASRNRRLQRRNLELRNASQVQGAELANNLSSLVQGAFTQSNITSFLPILTNNVYAPLTLNWIMLMYMYKTHGLIQTAIDQPVLDAYRGGLELSSSELDADDLKELEDRMEEMDFYGTMVSLGIWQRLFGGAAIVVNANGDYKKPLSYGEMKKQPLEFYDACRWELGSAHRYDKIYTFFNRTLDKTRVLTVAGKRAPFQIRWQLAGWGMSDIERVLEDFNLFLRTRNVLYEILDEAKVDVYRLDGLRDQLLTEAGTNQVRQRIANVNQIKNFENALLLDKLDEYDQKQMTFAGIAEIMQQNRMGLASAFRMPITKLFGISAAGFNSGEDDIENYNAMVESEVRQPSRPILRALLKMLSYSVYGDDYDIQFKFKPLRVMSSLEEEQVKTSKQNRAQALYDRMLLDSEEMGQLMQKEQFVPIDTRAAKGDLDEHPMSGDGSTDGQEGQGDDDGKQDGKRDGK